MTDPVFGSYEDLEGILRTAFGMYEDFKKAIFPLNERFTGNSPEKIPDAPAG